MIIMTEVSSHAAVTILFFLCITVQHAIGKSAQDTQHNLTFMLITSFGEFGFNSSGAIPAADVALDDINANSSMLPGYKLVYDKPRNSQVE